MLNLDAKVNLKDLKFLGIETSITQKTIDFLHSQALSSEISCTSFLLLLRERLNLSNRLSAAAEQGCFIIDYLNCEGSKSLSEINAFLDNLHSFLLNNDHHYFSMIEKYPRKLKRSKKARTNRRHYNKYVVKHLCYLEILDCEGIENYSKKIQQDSFRILTLRRGASIAYKLLLLRYINTCLFSQGELQLLSLLSLYRNPVNEFEDVYECNDNTRWTKPGYTRDFLIKYSGCYPNSQPYKELESLVEEGWLYRAKGERKEVDAFIRLSNAGRKKESFIYVIPNIGPYVVNYFYNKVKNPSLLQKFMEDFYSFLNNSPLIPKAKPLMSLEDMQDFSTFGEVKKQGVVSRYLDSLSKSHPKEKKSSTLKMTKEQESEPKEQESAPKEQEESFTMGGLSTQSIEIIGDVFKDFVIAAQKNKSLLDNYRYIIKCYAALEKDKTLLEAQDMVEEGLNIEDITKFLNNSTW
jgi:hypothetical protein